MNNLFLILLLTGVLGLISFSSCDKDDDIVLSGDAIPAEIQTYVDTHFPNNAIRRVRRDTDNGVITYEVSLQGNIELEFNEAKEIIEIDADTQLPDSVIMVEIRDYVQANYPNQTITDWELKGSEQHIELDNDLELVFDANGGFLRIND